MRKNSILIATLVGLLTFITFIGVSYYTSNTVTINEEPTVTENIIVDENQKDIDFYTERSNLEYYHIELRADKYYIMLTLPGEKPFDVGLYANSIDDAHNNLDKIFAHYEQKIKEAKAETIVIWTGKDSIQ